jgi:4-hydroxy-3-methylbut-2-enyl diphosphate reductase
MPKEFQIPRTYRSDLIESIKKRRVALDPRKTDLTPSKLEIGDVIFKVARFFGFCYGVENAIEIAYRAIEENPGKRVFLLSEMIHNQNVNADLEARGVKFLQSPAGETIIPFDELKPEDIVIVPAFGTTVALVAALRSRGISPDQYNATCPFVEKVWKRGRQLAQQGFAIVIHGKHSHEETRATFSHIKLEGPSVVVRDKTEAIHLARFIRGELGSDQFYQDFEGRYSNGFQVDRDLARIGVVNQTTMLAEETHEISQLVREALIARFGEGTITEHFADTRDTLCYATSENQRSMRALLDDEGDLAIVVGGYNSSNTSHLAELCEGRVPVFYVKDSSELVSADEIRHFDLHSKTVVTTKEWLPLGIKPLRILISAGASCPDSMVEAVISRVSEFFPGSHAIRESVQ